MIHQSNVTQTRTAYYRDLLLRGNKNYLEELTENVGTHLSTVNDQNQCRAWAKPLHNTC